ncbi:hypothetical protein AB1Y20_014066 [Prymnesium parvum]|uniref:Uncharacterized protein n=1 Tax=Prymnesium parvum TaxID=97485 RepID=A0AB34IGW4_PRYPA
MMWQSFLGIVSRHGRVTCDAPVRMHDRGMGNASCRGAQEWTRASGQNRGEHEFDAVIGRNPLIARFSGESRGGRARKGEAMNGKLLSSGAVMSDDNLALQVSKVSSLSSKVSLSWLSTPVLVLSLLASVLSGIVYVSYDAAVGPPPLVGIDIHRVTGIVLGMLLLLRISLGTAAVATAASKVQSFNKACRTLAVLSSYVGETLTISAGAELEKKAVAKFRFELVRLLNLAVFSYHLMLKGLKMTIPPVSMRVEGSKMESEILASCSNPSIMVVKWITLLIEQQRQAQRIGNEQEDRTPRSGGP